MHSQFYLNRSVWSGITRRISLQTTVTDNCHIIRNFAAKLTLITLGAYNNSQEHNQTVNKLLISASENICVQQFIISHSDSS